MPGINTGSCIPRQAYWLVKQLDDRIHHQPEPSPTTCRFSVFPHEPTIAYRITPSLTPYALLFSPNGVWALEFALQIAAIRDSDIVTIDNL